MWAASVPMGQGRQKLAGSRIQPYSWICRNANSKPISTSFDFLWLISLLSPENKSIRSFSNPSSLFPCQKTHGMAEQIAIFLDFESAIRENLPVARHLPIGSRFCLLFFINKFPLFCFLSRPLLHEHIFLHPRRCENTPENACAVKKKRTGAPGKPRTDSGVQNWLPAPQAPGSSQ